jgi:hypothetical protein
MSTTEITPPPFHPGVVAKVNLPAKYQAARQALAECLRVDEVKTMRDKALAMEVYALQQKDADLISASVYIRKRAERRIGELMEEERKAGLLPKGGAEKGTKRAGKGGKIMRVADGPALKKLEDRGIDKTPRRPCPQGRCHARGQVRGSNEQGDQDRGGGGDRRQGGGHGSAGRTPG